MSEKLLPCPFCGGLAVRWDGEPRIVCNSSGCGGEAESEAAWNRRTPAPEGEAVTVWYGKMPESNGRENWTASLRRVNSTDPWGQEFCFARSEYPDRVRYEADRVRWIIGELPERPDILAYDADKHSGYVPPASPVVPVGREVLVKAVATAINDRAGFTEYGPIIPEGLLVPIAEAAILAVLGTKTTDTGRE